MKEDFLHHIWLSKKLAVMSLFTTDGEPLEILNFGQYLNSSGPDFFNAQILLNLQHWVGNVEIHVKSSDWYLHNHQDDEKYNNVILHVVWEHDVDVFRKNNSIVPVLELKNILDTSDLLKYKTLMTQKKWINCEDALSDIDNIVLLKWKERLFFERLEVKSKQIQSELLETNNHWEQVLYALLFKNFGLKSNGSFFYHIAKTISYKTVQKEKHNLENLEALFFGAANLLNIEFEELYPKQLKTNWEFMMQKYGLETNPIVQPEFFKLRPDNFPTIRLAQFAALYFKNDNLFSKVIHATSINEIYNIFQVTPSKYWNSHYIFDKVSKGFKSKPVSKSFIDLLIINTIIPLKYVYYEYLGLDKSDEIIGLVESIKPEQNSIIDNFKKLNFKVSNAFDSQALLQLKKNYCENQKCLKCAIGISILNK